MNETEDEDDELEGFLQTRGRNGCGVDMVLGYITQLYCVPCEERCVVTPAGC